MDVAITGSSGLIGTALSKALTARGDRVIRVVRGAAGDGEVQWDIVAGTIDVGALEGVDAVVHLAGAGIGDKRWSPERKKELVDSRVLSTLLLARTLAGLDRKPSVLISGSAVGIYGDRGDEELTELAEPGTGFLAELPVAWEKAALPAVEAGIRTAFIRSGIVLSAEAGALKEQLLFFKLGIGGRFGDGKHYWSWISIDDEVGAILHLIDNEVSGPVNLTAPNPVTNAEYTEALGRAVRRPTFVPTPRFAVNIRLGSELAGAFLYTSTRALPGVLSDTGYVFTHETLDEALEDLL